MAENIYPGETAPPQQLLALANKYREASQPRFERSRKGEPLPSAPFHFIAIHAVELYLSAFLRQRGHDVGLIRGLHHDIEARTNLAQKDGLALRQRTIKHLRDLTANRDYLVTRYEPEHAPTTSQVDRLCATLKDVAKKVEAVVGTP